MVPAESKCLERDPQLMQIDAAPTESVELCQFTLAVLKHTALMQPSIQSYYKTLFEATF